LNRERRRIYHLKWFATHPDKKAEFNARWREKGFVPLAPNIWDCPVDWHHLSPNQPYVVPIPREIHRTVTGDRHFVFNATMVCTLYGLNFGGL
jgi:hypothetical protein